MGTNSRLIVKAISGLKMPLPHSTEKINKDLGLACELTQQIIDLASKTELDDLDKLNEKRLSLIESIFANDKANIDVNKAKELLALNSQAMSCLKEQMTLNIKAQQKSRKGNIAHSAYMNHTA